MNISKNIFHEYKAEEISVHQDIDFELVTSDTYGLSNDRFSILSNEMYNAIQTKSTEMSTKLQLNKLFI